MKNDYRDDIRERYRRRERKLRRMYRGRIFVVFVLALILGLLLGWIACIRLGDRVEKTPSYVPDDVVPAVATSMPEPTWSDPSFDDEDENAGDPFDLFGETAGAPAIVESEETDDPFGALAATDEPTEEPTAEPTEEPTSEPTEEPTSEPTEKPTAEPTEEPTAEPTEEPTAEPTEEPTAEPAEEPTSEPTEEPTSEPTEEPTAEPTEEPTAEPAEEPDADTDEPQLGDAQQPVAMNEEYSFTMQVLADGTPRSDTSETEYFDVPVTIVLTRHMDSRYYAENYGTSYQLKGDEACCELKVTLGDCDGINSFSLQAALPMVLVDAEGNVIPGYQFKNAEIGGETDSGVAVGSSAMVYKRYSENPQIDPVSLMVTYYVDGQMKEVYFSLREPVAEEEPVAEGEPSEGEPAETEPAADPAGESYTIGSSGEGVIKLQEKLIQLGYLSGNPDGEFGKWTAAAVEQAQKDFGLDATGVADAAFLAVLYSK